MTQFNNDFSKEIYYTTYRYGDELTIDDTFHRVAEAVSSVEKDAKLWETKFFHLMEDFKFVPGGRILSNVGTNVPGVTALNCFSDGFFGVDKDSMEGIFKAITRQALILKSEGGYGINISVLRPRGAFIQGIANETPGPVKFLEIWDKVSEVVTEGSGKKSEHKNAKTKIRKGAMICILNIWHPDIEEFITAKQNPGNLTKFNMSIGITDEFMDAVINHKPWILEFPDYDIDMLVGEGGPDLTKGESIKQIYKNRWNGNLKEWKDAGLPTKIYKVYQDANELWDLIMKSTYNRNEPGILFIDRINHWNNLWYEEYIDTCNPCLTGDTMIYTDQGIRSIGSMIINSEIDVISNEMPETGNWKSFINRGQVIDSGVKQIIKLYLSNGQELKVTPEHRLWTEEGYVEAQNCLNKQLRIVTDYVFPQHKDFFDSQKYHNLLNKEVFDRPADLAFIMGWITGDGWISDHKIGMIFGKDDSDILLKVKSILARWKMHASSVVDEHLSTTLYISNVDFQQFLYDMGFEKCIAGYKRIPKKIFQCSQEIVTNYLDGLFSADGTVISNQRSKYWTCLSSKSKGLLNDVQILLNAMNITHHSVYHINKKSLFEYTTKNNVHRTYEGDDYYDLRIFGKSIIKFNEICVLSSNRKQKKILSLLNKKFKTKIPIVEVIKIEHLQPEPVYDITTSKYHNFVANNLLVHNCGEQPLPIGGVCLLGSFNLTQYVKDNDWNYEALMRDIPTAVRFLDNINDIAIVPLPEQKENLLNKRRIGMGIMGYASALIMMNIEYGSEKALEVTDKLMKFIVNQAYQSSALLAKEKKAFPLYDEKYLKGNFVNSLDIDTIELIREYGIRNSHLLTIAPTGNTSTMANNVSGGLEPVFALSYIRTHILPSSPKGLKLPKNINWETQKCENQDNWVWMKEGDEPILVCEWCGDVYKIDRNRHLTKETRVYDYGFKQLNITAENYSIIPTVSTLSLKQHIDTMKVFATYVDAAISKTINIPNDYLYEDFKRIYLDLYLSERIKGGTSYRIGTMASVLSETSIQIKDSRDSETLIKTHAPKRPKRLNCDIHHITAKGLDWVVLVGMMNGGENPLSPYEVFAFKKTSIKISPRISKGILVRVKSGLYNLELEDITFENITSLFEQDEEEALTRMISISLRHGVDISYIIEQLNKSEGTVASFSKAILRALKRYVDGDQLKEKCPECGRDLIYSEGCIKCSECTYSKC